MHLKRYQIQDAYKDVYNIGIDELNIEVKKTQSDYFYLLKIVAMINEHLLVEYPHKI